MCHRPIQFIKLIFYFSLLIDFREEGRFLSMQWRWLMLPADSKPLNHSLPKSLRTLQRLFREFTIGSSGWSWTWIHERCKGRHAPLNIYLNIIMNSLHSINLFYFIFIIVFYNSFWIVKIGGSWTRSIFWWTWSMDLVHGGGPWTGGPCFVR